MKKILMFITLISTLQIVHSQDTKKVLFLGNSYTAANNLPNLISQMATNTGDVLIYDSNTPGGHRLMNHASNNTTTNKINSDDWDFVTLQAQSQETSFSQAQMEIELYPFASQLVNTIRTNYNCSQPLFYMTWGRENGDNNNCAFIPWVCTYEGMDDAIRSAYIFMAEENTSEVAPVGAIWRYLRTNHPEIDLYTNDGSHPSLAGSYAAACAFYTMIFKKDPTLITWNSSLNETHANTIKLATKTIVYNIINDWDYTANFNYTIDDNYVTFTNDYPADSVSWNFGDGLNSVEDNPTHIYESIGDFEVILTITSCGRTHVVTKTVSITSLSINDYSFEKIVVYPNPALNELHIKGINKSHLKAKLYNVLGQEIKSFMVIGNTTLSISDIENGTYFLKIFQNNNTSIIKRIIKQ
ncbi:T9SS type A sorting domain-containing protein [Psychroserpens sp. S379A]|uniref:T9SS type A sorting domain-containing protein n=1 Tax=Psychroserpens sp. S379A TaxID=3415137 RepID=UPI003C797B12